jgi:hypothetical protein
MNVLAANRGKVAADQSCRGVVPPPAMGGDRVIDAAWPRNQVAPTSYTLRSSDGIAVFLAGLDLIEPGLVPPVLAARSG